jgi:hypothetical protein
MKLEPPRIMAALTPLPRGISEPDPTVYLQAVMDAEGRLVRPIHIGGPKVLVPAAIEGISRWRTMPMRLNGVGLLNPVILQVIFR